MVDVVYRVDWTESERGWGQKSMGHTDFDTLVEAEQAIKDHCLAILMDRRQITTFPPSKPYLAEKKEDA